MPEIEQLRRERDAWKTEAERLLAAKPRPGTHKPGEMTLQDIRRWLEEHRWTHIDWATWFEAHPDDPRAKSGLGDAAFHRGVEARYTAMLACLDEVIGKPARAVP